MQNSLLRENTTEGLFLYVKIVLKDLNYKKVLKDLNYKKVIIYSLQLLKKFLLHFTVLY